MLPFLAPRLLRCTFDVFEQENISLQEQQALPWFFLCFHVPGCFLWAFWHIVVPSLFPGTLITHIPPPSLWLTLMLAPSHFSFLTPAQFHSISIATCAQTPSLPSSQDAQAFAALVTISFPYQTGFLEQPIAPGLRPKNPPLLSDDLEL